MAGTFSGCFWVISTAPPASAALTAAQFTALVPDQLSALTTDQMGALTDKQLGTLLGKHEDEIRSMRKSKDITPDFKLVDTCAAEFQAHTPYYYSTYDK